MPLCGSQSGCGCAITSTPAETGAIDGHLPSINVSGSGQPGDPWDLSLNDGWADAVADAINGLDWVDYVPAIAGLNLGSNPGRVHRYARINDVVHVMDKITLGAGGGVTGNVIIARPVPGDTEAQWLDGVAILTPPASGLVPCKWRSTGTTNTQAYYMTTDNAWVQLANFGASTPVAWTAGSVFWRWGTYRPG